MKPDKVIAESYVGGKNIEIVTNRYSDSASARSGRDSAEGFPHRKFRWVK